MSDSSIRAALELALGILPEAELENLIRLATARTYPAGSIICREGEMENVFYVIQDGTIAFTKKIAGGDQFLGLKARGEFFGELGVLDKAPRAATVHAISECRLIEIDGDTLDDVLNRNPSVTRAIMRGITRSMRDTDQITIAELQLKNAELARTLDNLRAAQAELVRRERLKRDLEIAVQVHKSILPTTFPTVPGFEFAAMARPAREIGGDLYDVFDMGQDQAGIIMADASGKSVQAAIYMAVVRALFLSEAHPGSSPSETAHHIHNLLLRASTAEMFVTVFYATLNYATREMCYIRAGHDRPVYYRAASDDIILLNPPGRFMGLLPNLLVEEERLALGSGDLLVCYSDGVTDAIRPDDGEMYGLDRLKEIIYREKHRPAQDLVEAIVCDVDDFRAGEEQPDDLTLLVTRVV